MSFFFPFGSVRLAAASMSLFFCVSYCIFRVSKCFPNCFHCDQYGYSPSHSLCFTICNLHKYNIFGVNFERVFVSDCPYSEMLLFAKSFQMILEFSISLSLSPSPLLPHVRFSSVSNSMQLFVEQSSFHLYLCEILHSHLHWHSPTPNFSSFIKKRSHASTFYWTCPLNNCFTLISPIQSLSKMHSNLSTESTNKRYSTIYQFQWDCTMPEHSFKSHNPTSNLNT